MSNFLFFGVFVGLISGLFAGLKFTNIISSKLSNQSDNPRLIIIFTKLGALISLLPSAFLSYAIGGNFGGGWGAMLGLGYFGIATGITFCIALLLISGLVVGACFGALIGKGVVYVL